MQYREHRPSARLASAVACFWTLEGHARELGDESQPVLPDGRAEFVVQFGDRFDRCDPEAGPQSQPAAIFAGQIERPLALRPTGHVAVLGVRFRPDGAAQFMRVPQHELIGSTLDVACVSPALAAAARVVRDTAPTLQQAVPIMERLLVDAMTTGARERRLAFAVDTIVRRGGLVSIDDAARAAGLGRRQLERLFLRDVGLPAKQLARIVRFQRALRILERDPHPPRGVRAAQASGYADQAHFIRDFRELAGCAPRQHLLRGAELTGLFSGRDDRRSR
ncbi:MAG TPA: helix-turn-helix transcriptional regulator [Vicinamibacterales bacterium]|nr:helix-turn-helix transcriptional regulator [Vicinamibacterales bacterium]